MKALLLASLCSGCVAMDNPAIPQSVRDSYNAAMADVQKAKEDIAKGKRHSRERSTVDIKGTITDADGKEVVIDIVKESTLTKSGDGSNEGSSKSDGYTKRFVVITNSVTAVLMGLIGVGATIAVKYGDCKK